MKIKTWMLMAALTCGLSICIVSCKDDNDSQPPEEPTAVGAPLQVMVVFAPGQLGDNGYADNIMESVYRLKNENEDYGTDTVDVRFISSMDIDDTREATLTWALGRNNPFTQQPYDRRLLVLTESYMQSWLTDLKHFLGSDDEVLLLKVNDSDVTRAAAASGLDNRLHGLNISAAASVRRFCRYMDEHLEDLRLDNPNINADSILLFRLFNDSEVTYRDSVYETLAECLGTTNAVSRQSLTDRLSDDVQEGEGTLLLEAFKCAEDMKRLFDTKGCAFHVADLGAANSGIYYYMMGVSDNTFNILMLDTDGTLTIKRDFSTPLYKWVVGWMHQTQTGAMPRCQEFGGWNSNYVTDNFYFYDDEGW